ncbi:hypothetical protein OSB04_012885 [Centaurea solstitialis]|uniref:No apical meristem-associated C-terminal domain-containing protein n=1 Tax=Centaurea solstitialis TaxID=347529 RepID=A0AA38TQ49_9ASTR|nr:hypothetical protein OSB04_012885 [Centaurea solstitialis]
MDKHGSGSGSRRGNPRPNVSVPTSQTSPTPPPTVGYRPQMMRPMGFPTAAVEGWGYPQTPGAVSYDWAYAHLLAQHTYVPGEQQVNPSPPGVWDIRDDDINLDDDDIDDHKTFGGRLKRTSTNACITSRKCSYPSNVRRSGETDIDILNRAKDRFHSEYHKAFTHEHAWRQVKDSPKFDAVKMQDPKNIRAPTYKRSKTSETPTDSPGESDARTHHVNFGNDDLPSPTERPRPMGQNAARRAGSSTTAASTESVSNIATSLEAIATNVSSIMGSINNRQRSVDLKTFMAPHDHLTGIQLQIMLEEKEIIAERYGWQKYW